MKKKLTMALLYLFIFLNCCVQKKNVIYGHYEIEKILNEAGIGYDSEVKFYSYMYALEPGVQYDIVLKPDKLDGKDAGIGVKVIYKRDDSPARDRNVKMYNTSKKTEYFSTTGAAGYRFSKHDDNSFHVTLINEYSAPVDVVVYFDYRE